MIKGQKVLLNRQLQIIVNFKCRNIQLIHICENKNMKKFNLIENINWFLNRSGNEIFNQKRG